MNTLLRSFRIACSCLLATATLVPSWGQVVTDNFDDGDISDWQQRNVLQPLGGYVENSFPTVGAGKGLRLQRGSANMSVVGVPQAYGTGRAWLFRTNVYTDFYVAADLVDWNNGTNQALVLLARASGYDEVFAPGFPPGLGTTDGYVANYDNAQDGTGPGDRRGGQFQINRVDDEGPSTIAGADVTLIPGHSYRMVFKGVGARLTAHLYDHHDLTRPIVTIEADDTDYISGVSGLVTFHRDDNVHPNRSDMTVDNYYAGPSDPDAATLPRIQHPLAGTPQITVRTPAARNANFHPATSGLTFTASTLGTGQVDAAATKLFLNGVDVSSSLAPLPANGATASFNTAAGTLASNTVYAARIELADTTGQFRSTHTFWFDTFSASYISTAPAKTIEAEDYNYNGGTAQSEPVPISGATTTGGVVGGNGVGYLGVVGVADVDFHDNRTTPDGAWIEYRDQDPVSTMQGGIEEIEDIRVPPGATPSERPNDAPRPLYTTASVLEYQVARTEPGEWLNYTRTFTAGSYYAYLRAGSFGDTVVHLAQVTSDPTQPNQTTNSLGTFVITNHMARYSYRYVPLTANGQPVTLALSGPTTLRLAMGGTPTKDNRLLALNYLLFVPVPAATAPVLESAATVTGPYATDAAGIVDTGAKTVTLPAPTGNRFYRLSAPSALTIQSIQRQGGNLVISYQ